MNEYTIQCCIMRSTIRNVGSSSTKPTSNDPGMLGFYMNGYTIQCCIMRSTIRNVGSYFSLINNLQVLWTALRALTMAGLKQFTFASQPLPTSTVSIPEDKISEINEVVGSVVVASPGFKLALVVD